MDALQDKFLGSSRAGVASAGGGDPAVTPDGKPAPDKHHDDSRDCGGASPSSSSSSSSGVFPVAGPWYGRLLRNRRSAWRLAIAGLVVGMGVLIWRSPRLRTALADMSHDGSGAVGTIHDGSGGRYRTPVGLAVTRDGRRAFTANSTADSVSVVDLQNGAVVAEVACGRQPVAVALSRDGARLAVAEHESDSVSVFANHDGTLTGRTTIRTGGRPRGLAFSADGKRIFVALSAFDEVAELSVAEGAVTRRFPVPAREPSAVALSPDGTTLAVTLDRGAGVLQFDTADGRCVACDLMQRREHGIRIGEGGFPKDAARRAVVVPESGSFVAVAWSPDGNRLAAPYLGLMGGHSERRIPQSGVHRRRADGTTRWVGNRGYDYPIADWRLGFFRPVPPTGFRPDARPDNVKSPLPGSPAPVLQFATDPAGLRSVELPDGAADIEAVAFSPDGTLLAVAAGGSHEVVLLDGTNGRQTDRFAAGVRPTAVAFAGAGTLVVADGLEDAVLVLDAKTGKVRHRIAVGGDLPMSEACRGESIFRDASLSYGNGLSCNTCHRDGHTTGRIYGGIGSHPFGIQGRLSGGPLWGLVTPSLRGVVRTGPWTLEGNHPDLPAALKESLWRSLAPQREEPPAEDIAALAAFVGTLRWQDSPHLAEDGSLTPAAARGRRLFTGKAGCADCHRGSAATAPEAFEVGTETGWGKGILNPPSLRGAWARGPYLHTGEAADLDAVLTGVHRPENVGGEELTPAERADLVAYVKSL